MSQDNWKTRIRNRENPRIFKDVPEGSGFSDIFTKKDSFGKILAYSQEKSYFPIILQQTLCQGISSNVNTKQ